MTPYNAPLDNIRFLINDVFDYPQHYAKFSQLNDLTPDVVDAIISECANFCEKELERDDIDNKTSTDELHDFEII